jgi:hypothetical protein
MKKGEIKSGSKYKRRWMEGGKYHYDYGEEKKPKKLVVKIDAEKPKYFKTEEDKKEYLEREKQGLTTGYGKKIKSTFGRIKSGTLVSFSLPGASKKKFFGKVIGSDGTSSRGPEHFDIEYTVNGLKTVASNVPKDKVERSDKSWFQSSLERKKSGETKTEDRAIKHKDSDERVMKIAKDLVMKDWGKFSKIAGAYYKSRMRKGWNAANYGYEEKDLINDTFLVVYNSALSYLKNKKNKEIPFEQYVNSFLKSNLAAKLAVGSGGGGHLSASGKDQLYLWFFKDTIEEVRGEKGSEPSDVELLEILEKKRKSLPDEEGHKTIRDYEWTLEKIKNKRAQSRGITSLDIQLGKEEDSDTLLSILDSESLQSVGHYKTDPWVELEKKLVKDAVRDGMKKILSPTDREIMIRTYGLFVDENSPEEVRRYALGEPAPDIAKYLNKVEAEKGSLKRWTATTILERRATIIDKLKNSPEFKREVQPFFKSENNSNKEWTPLQWIAYWVTLYEIVERSLSDIGIWSDGMPLVPENQAIIKPPESGDIKPRRLLIIRNK